MNKFARRLIIHIILPLVAGLAIYILFRKNTWLHHHLLPQGFNPVTLPQNWLSNFFIFNFPDFCWSYSLSCALFMWNSGNQFIAPAKFAIGVVALLIVVEVIQLWMPSRFTFDWLDLAATLIAFCLSWVQYRKNEHP